MNLIRSLLTGLVCTLLYFSSFSQSDSCNLKISLLTCGPGEEELYSVFGHSALRVIDRSAQTDIIYNYGTFDFEDPDFYLKFVKGKLLYYVSAAKFPDFVYEYKLENRNIIEQVLNLNCREKEKLYNALRTNALEQNKYYKYHFFFDNCSTRLRDIVVQNTEDSLHFKRIIPVPPPTFREMIHVYLDKGHQYWGEFGIDLLLGSKIDRKVKNEETMFLPDYLMKGFDSAVLRNSPVVQEKREILPNNGASVSKNDVSVFTPMTATILILVVGVALTFAKKKWARRALDVFDVGFFLVLGIAGCFILFMWFGTEHDLCRSNYNILWALPTNLIFVFFILKNKPFVRKYLTITAMIALAMLLTWPVMPQGMNSAFFPLVLLLAIRSIHRVMKK